jgi:hypothetical protein
VTRPWLAVAAATCAAGLCLAAACAEEAEGPVTDGTATGDTVADGPVEATDLGAGLVADLPAGTPVERLTPLGDSGGDEPDCSYFQGAVGEGDDRIDLSLNAASCAGEPEGQIGNGYHGRYLDVDDAAEAGDVEVATVPAGRLTTFTQPYYECTNECNDYDDNVGLLALTASPEPDHPVLMLLAEKGEPAMADVVALASAIRVG